MAIIVEDGTGVINANSYVTYAEALAYAEARGKGTSFADDELTATFLIRAVDYLQSVDFLGYPYWVDQELNWPRDYIYVNGVRLAYDVIPKAIKSAQIEAALLIASGIDIMPTISGAFVKREKVGPIETEYSEAFGFGSVSMSIVDALLGPYIGGGWGLRTVRI